MFKRIPDNFFMPLASPGRAVYWECLQILFGTLGINYSIERSILVEELKEYFERPLSADIKDDSDNTINNPGERANDILRQLRDYGWLEFEIDKNYVQHINFSEPAIKIFNTIMDIENGEVVEYSGSVLRIYSQVKASQAQNADILLENIYDDTVQLITELQTLNANIKHYIEDLANRHSVSELFDVLFNDYSEKIIHKAYHRLVTSDNISKVRPDIIEILTRRSRDKRYLNRVARGFAERHEINEEEGLNRAKEYLYFIIEQFKNMDNILDEIHRKNRNYISSAVNRTKYLMSDTEDIKGQLKGILSYLNDTVNQYQMDLHSIYDIEFLDSLIQIYSSLFPDENSLYNPPAEKEKFIPVELTNTLEDPVLQNKKIKGIIERINNQLSPERINQYVLEQLSLKNSLPISEFPLKSIEDFVKIIYIQLYGFRNNMDYIIEFSINNRIHSNGFSFDDFLVRKKNYD